MTAFSASPQPSLRIRLAQVVLEEYRRWGSYDRLAIEIAAVNRPADEHKLNRHKVDRRKLKKIAQREKVSLSPDELEALNTYLIGFGKGLAAIFGQPSIVKSLVETGQVTFLLGSRPRDDRRTIELAGWDFRTMDVMMRSGYRAAHTVHTAVEEVFLRSGKDDLSSATYRDLFDGEPWFSLLDDKDGPSLVCIGSPLACHATELVLASMFDVQPFQHPDPSARAQLPFLFIWTQQQYDEWPSAFAVTATDIPQSAQDESASNSLTPMLYSDGTCYCTNLSSKSYNTYGLVAAQRRRTGQLWLVITGVNGPGTLATARAIDSITMSIPQGETGQHGSVVWALVQGDIESSSDRRGDVRDLTNQRLLSEPSKWPSDGQKT